ncbi:hypothetical protein ABTY61_02735 [Kitasatospora sp. NPDC096128]|uniref:hypothetical protein n=1 Tax=Kitasatospora sp. NPDC096128 TaxID=3155547 RepID=UPI0033213DB2
MTHDENLPTGSVEGAEAAPEESPLAAGERDEQEYFENLAAVKDSILEGVITHW